jgi:hypothetical protein
MALLLPCDCDRANTPGDWNENRPLSSCKLGVHSDQGPWSEELSYDLNDASYFLRKENGHQAHIIAVVHGIMSCVKPWL